MTKAQREAHIEMLDMCLQVDVNISCDYRGCKNSDHTEDEYNAAQEFYKKGWRVNREGYARCPKHAPKQKQ